MFADRYKLAMAFQEVFSADATRAIGRMAADSRIESVDVFNGAALATHATNYVTFKLINLGTDAQGTTVIATASTSQTTGSAMAANVAFPLTVNSANVNVSSGHTIGLIYDESTTDVANSQSINVVVRYVQIGA